MFRKLFSLLVLIHLSLGSNCGVAAGASDEGSQAATAQTASTSEPPANGADSAGLYLVKVMAMGLGEAVAVPEDLSDGRALMSELSKNPNVVWTRQFVLPVVPYSKTEIQAGEQTPVVTGLTMSGRNQEPIRNYSQIATGTIVQIADLHPREGGVTFDLAFEISRLNQMANKAEASVSQELQTQMQNGEFKGKLNVPDKKTVVIQAASSSADGKDTSGNILIFITAQKVN